MNLVSGLTDKRYRLLERLGQSRTNPIWLADKLWFDGAPVRSVALKTMATLDEAGAQRRDALFQRETAITMTLQHRNIVRVDAWGSDLFGDTHFFEMQHIKGLSLLELLHRRGGADGLGPGALPPQDVAWIGMQAAAGLDYAHHHCQLEREHARDPGPADLTPESQRGVDSPMLRQPVASSSPTTVRGIIVVPRATSAAKSVGTWSTRGETVLLRGRPSTRPSEPRLGGAAAREISPMSSA